MLGLGGWEEEEESDPAKCLTYLSTGRYSSKVNLPYHELNLQVRVRLKKKVLGITEACAPPRKKSFQLQAGDFRPVRARCPLVLLASARSPGGRGKENTRERSIPLEQGRKKRKEMGVKKWNWGGRGIFVNLFNQRVSLPFKLAQSFS